MTGKVTNRMCLSRYEFAEYPSDLKRPARIILGLMHVGVIDFNLIGRAIGYEETPGSKAWKRWMKILRDNKPASQQAMVAEILERGLPLSALAELEGGVTYRCPRCGQQRHAVPCFTCPATWKARDEDEDDIPFDDPDLPTDLVPGSPEKVELMAIRVALGQSPFHPGDKFLENGYAKCCKFDTVSIGRLEREWDYRED